MKQYIVELPRQTLLDEIVKYSVHATDEKDALDIVMAGEFDSEDVEVIGSRIKKLWAEHAKISEKNHG